MRGARAKMSRHSEVAKAMDYMPKRWDTFSRFLDDGRICLTNNAAERALRGIALGRKAWLFCGSGRGGERAAAMYSLIVTAKLNIVDPRAWLADVLARISDHPARRLNELLPWNWRQPSSVRRKPSHLIRGSHRTDTSFPERRGQIWRRPTPTLGRLTPEHGDTSRPPGGPGSMRQGAHRARLAVPAHPDNHPRAGAQSAFWLAADAPRPGLCPGLGGPLPSAHC